MVSAADGGTETGADVVGPGGNTALHATTMSARAADADPRSRRGALAVDRSGRRYGCISTIGIERRRRAAESLRGPKDPTAVPINASLVPPPWSSGSGLTPRSASVRAPRWYRACRSVMRAPKTMIQRRFKVPIGPKSRVSASHNDSGGTAPVVGSRRGTINADQVPASRSTTGARSSIAPERPASTAADQERRVRPLHGLGPPSSRAEVTPRASAMKRKGRISGW